MTSIDKILFKKIGKKVLPLGMLLALLPNVVGCSILNRREPIQLHMEDVFNTISYTAPDGTKAILNYNEETCDGKKIIIHVKDEENEERYRVGTKALEESLKFVRAEGYVDYDIVETLDCSGFVISPKYGSPWSSDYKTTPRAVLKEIGENSDSLEYELFFEKPHISQDGGGGGGSSGGSSSGGGDSSGGGSGGGGSGGGDSGGGSGGGDSGGGGES